jgi:hypothetical protein
VEHRERLLLRRADRRRRCLHHVDLGGGDRQVGLQLAFDLDRCADDRLAQPLVDRGLLGDLHLDAGDRPLTHQRAFGKGFDHPVERDVASGHHDGIRDRSERAERESDSDQTDETDPSLQSFVHCCSLRTRNVDRRGAAGRDPCHPADASTGGLR